MSNAVPSRKLDEKLDRWFYREPYRIAPELLPQICPVRFPFACELWKQITGGQNARSLKQLPFQHWIHTSIRTGPNWYLDWNNPTHPGPVIDFLRSAFSWKDEDLVFILLDDEFTYQLNWQMFIQNWRAFSYEEDGLLMLKAGDAEYGYLGDAGVLHCGKRTLLKLLDSSE